MYAVFGEVRLNVRIYIVGRVSECASMDDNFSRSTHKFWLEFLECYRNEPALWKVGSKEYKNRDEKRRAYVRLLHKYREAHPNATVDSVKKKINNLRSNFRKELKKINAYSANGEHYEPTLYYFKSLLFLQDLENTENGSFMMMDSDEEIDAHYNTRLTPSPEQVMIDETQSFNISPVPSTSYNQPPKKVKITPCEVLKKEEKSNANLLSDEYFDLVGQLWANKLKRLPEDIQLIAEKAVNDILFEAQMGKMNPENYISTSSSRRTACCCERTPLNQIMRECTEIDKNTLKGESDFHGDIQHSFVQ